MRKGILLLAGIVPPVLAATELVAQPEQAWRFVEDLKLGSEADDATGFSDVRGLLVDRLGNLWILEFSTKEIRVFDRDGKHLRNIGRSGKGPGEFTYPDGMEFGPDGLVWVHDPQNARFTIFDQQGKFVRQQLAVSNGYGYRWMGGIDTQGRIWDRLFLRDPADPQAWSMRRASADWSRVDTLKMPRCSQPDQNPEAQSFRLPRGFIAVPFYPASSSAIDYRQGILWCLPTGAEYLVLKLAVERPDTITRITGRAEPVRVSAAERDSAIAGVRRFMERAGGSAAVDWSRIPRLKPLVLGLQVDDDGRLWIRRSTSSANVAAFDLYSPAGAPLGHLTVAHPVSRWHRPITRGQTVYFLTQQDGEVPYVVRGRIVPGR